MIRQTHLK